MSPKRLWFEDWLKRCSEYSSLKLLNVVVEASAPLVSHLLQHSTIINVTITFSRSLLTYTEFCLRIWDWRNCKPMRIYKTDSIIIGNMKKEIVDHVNTCLFILLSIPLFTVHVLNFVIPTSKTWRNIKLANLKDKKR